MIDVFVKNLDGHTTKSRNQRAKTPSASSVVNISFASFSLLKGGQVLAVGENGMAQLGLKTAILQRQNPQPVPIPDPVMQIAAGPLHSVVLTEKNQIYTFGCNDEHALGRKDNDDEDDDEADQFGLVDMSTVLDPNQEKIIQIAGGDSHTVVLSDLGKVYGNTTCFHQIHLTINFSFRSLEKVGEHFVRVQLVHTVSLRKALLLKHRSTYQYLKKSLKSPVVLILFCFSARQATFILVEMEKLVN